MHAIDGFSGANVERYRFDVDPWNGKKIVSLASPAAAFTEIYFFRSFATDDSECTENSI